MTKFDEATEAHIAKLVAEAPPLPPEVAAQVAREFGGIGVDSTVTAHPRWDLLGRAVRTRRIALRLYQVDLAEKAGISTATVKNVEQGCRETYSERTLTGIEAALAWPPGTATSLTHGGVSPAKWDALTSGHTAENAQARNENGPDLRTAIQEVRRRAFDLNDALTKLERKIADV